MKILKVTRKFLTEMGACSDGLKWWMSNCKGLSTENQLIKLVNYRGDWANWLIVRLFDLEQKRKYAIFAAESVLDIFEKKYPNDKRPRQAIEAAKVVLRSDTLDNRNATAAASSAAYAAYASSAAVAAADVAYAAAAAASSAAADVAYAAAAASSAAADVAYAATAYAYASSAADAAAVYAKKELQIKIINYGISLLKGKDNEQA